MLPYILAIAVAIYSLILFGLAFFAPVIHRKDDFLWSGIGLFYALVLWLCAGLISGAVLLGQSAATVLLISFGWQTVKLRRAIAYPDQSDEFSIVEWVQSRLGSSGRKKPSLSTPPKPEEVVPPETPQGEALKDQETLIPPENEEALASTSLTVTEDEKGETLAEEIVETALNENIELPIPVTPETEDVVKPQEVAQPETVAEKAPKTLAEFPPNAKGKGRDGSRYNAGNPRNALPQQVPDPSQPKTQQKKGFSWKNVLSFGKKLPPQPTPETFKKAINQLEGEFGEDEPWSTPEPTAKTVPVEEKPLVTPVEVSEETFSTEEFETFVPDETDETVIESDRFGENIGENNSSDYVFDPLVADENAETVIENYQPELDKTEAKKEDNQIVSPAKPVELEETQPQTEERNSEIKNEN